MLPDAVHVAWRSSQHLLLALSLYIFKVMLIRDSINMSKKERSLNS